MLRDYQQKAVDAVRAEWANGVQSTLGVAAVGAGKTNVFLALLVEELTKNPKARALVLAHREELIYQPIERLYQFWPEWKGQAGAVMAEYDECDRRIVVATVQTLNSGNRLARVLAHGAIDYVVTDEAIHAVADTYQAVYQALREANPDVRHLGVTATPMREDKKGMAEVYESVAFKYGLKEMIKAGWLVPPRWLAIHVKLSIKGVSKHDGDYSAKGLGSVYECDNCFDLVVASHHKYAQERQAIAFTPTVDGAYRLAAKFREGGIVAQAADGTTPREERRRVLTDFRAGKTKVLVNVGIFTEGLDIPQTSCIHMVRPTGSDALYTQCLDDATEILTKRGWMGKDQIAKDDLVAGLDLGKNAICWAAMQQKIERSLAPGERMYGLFSDCVDIRVTGGHRMIYRNKNAGAKWRISTADEMAKRKSDYVIPVAGHEKVEGLPLTDHEIRFIAWVMTDGCINSLNGQITISQAEHQPYHQQIEDTLKRCGFKYGVHRQCGASNFRRRSAQINYTVSRGQPRGRDKHLSGWGRLEPYLSKGFSPLLEEMDERQLAVLLETVNFADGSKQHQQYISKGRPWTRRTLTIHKGNRLFVERLQGLCVRRGWRCNVVEATSSAGKPFFRLHAYRETDRYVGGQTAGAYDGRPVLHEVAAVPGEVVWCVQNELGTLVTRRHGKVAILGNCIGRALRLSPGKEDALVLDYVPLEARNLTLMGDILGLDTRKEVYIADPEQAEEGDVLGGFTFDGKTKWMSGDPMEIISRQLDYLQLSAFAWHQDNRSGWLTLGLGEARDGIERTLAISKPDADGQCELWLVWTNRQALGHGNQAVLGQVGTFEEVSERADLLIEKYHNAALAARSRGWRKQPASPGQAKFASSLKVWQEGLTKGACAEVITHALAMRAITRMQKRFGQGAPFVGEPSPYFVAAGAAE